MFVITLHTQIDTGATIVAQNTEFGVVGIQEAGHMPLLFDNVIFVTMFERFHIIH